MPAIDEEISNESSDYQRAERVLGLSGESADLAQGYVDPSKCDMKSEEDVNMEEIREEAERFSGSKGNSDVQNMSNADERGSDQEMILEQNLVPHERDDLKEPSGSDLEMVEDSASPRKSDRIQNLNKRNIAKLETLQHEEDEDMVEQRIDVDIVAEGSASE